MNPLSENETIGMVNFTNLHKFDLTISLHSQGEEIYYDAGKTNIEKALNLGNKFAKVSGYNLTKPSYKSSFAGYKDWFVKKFGNPGYTIELGRGEEGKPLPLKLADEIFYKMEDVFLIAIQDI